MQDLAGRGQKSPAVRRSILFYQVWQPEQDAHQQPEIGVKDEVLIGFRGYPR